MCANRILIQEGVYDEFTEKLMAAAADMRMGNGADVGVTMGPLINEGAANDVMEFIGDAVAKGANVVAGVGYGSRHARGCGGNR